MSEHSAYIAYVRRPRAQRINILNGKAYRSPVAGLRRKKTFKLWVEDPEAKRRKRVAKYKIYTVEGKMKSSFKKGMRWIKRKCSLILHGY